MIAIATRFGVSQFVVFAAAEPGRQPGAWRFSVRVPGGAQTTVRDVEPGVSGDRLELLAVVRALESLDGPSRVTLYTPSTYVREGIERGLRNWRDDQWTWEHFGQRVEVRDADLWQRLDVTLEFHRVSCRWWRIEAPHAVSPQPRPKLRTLRRRAHRPTFGQRLAAWCGRQLDQWTGSRRAAWAS